ncbi:yciC, partial [Symbiodinium natans]
MMWLPSTSTHSSSDGMSPVSWKSASCRTGASAAPLPTTSSQRSRPLSCGRRTIPLSMCGGVERCPASRSPCAGTGVALDCQLPVALRSEVARVVTVVDASTFSRDWLDSRQALERNRLEEVRSHAPS